jgi:hypothetical protein
MKYIFVALLWLSITSCSNDISDQNSSSDHSHSTPSLDDWKLAKIHDVISQTDMPHLIKIIQPTNNANISVQVDLTCPKQGVISAEIDADPAIYIWQQSAGDFVAQGLLRAAGAVSNPVSTLVQWRIGKSIHKSYIGQGKYNNVADIADFSTLSPAEPWTGSLAISTETDHGQIAIETSVDTPNAQAFIKLCSVDPEKLKVEREKKAAATRAATERANVKKKAEATFMEAFQKKWPKCLDSERRDDYYAGKTDDGKLVKLRNLSVNHISDAPVPAADRADGIEWNGTVTAQFYTYRLLKWDNRDSPSFTGAWAQDVNGPKGCEDLRGNVSKRNGQWIATVHDWWPSCAVHPVPCF